MNHYTSYIVKTNANGERYFQTYTKGFESNHGKQLTIFIDNDVIVSEDYKGQEQEIKKETINFPFENAKIVKRGEKLYIENNNGSYISDIGITASYKNESSIEVIKGENIEFFNHSLYKSPNGKSGKSNFSFVNLDFNKEYIFKLKAKKNEIQEEEIKEKFNSESSNTNEVVEEEIYHKIDVNEKIIKIKNGVETTLYSDLKTIPISKKRRSI